MGSIWGLYQWDDDDLTPGRKREGGLHQNLFDEDGRLKGSARFIPAKEPELRTVPITDNVTENVYVPAEERRLSPEQQELAEIVSAVLVVFLQEGIERAKPHVKRWWADSVRPFVEEQHARLGQLRSGRVSKGDRLILEIRTLREEIEQLSKRPKDAAPEATVAVSRPKMSAAEAEARYLAAMAAQAFSEEQIRMVRNADIIGVNDVSEIEMWIAELPPNEVHELLSGMVTDPSKLGEETLANLASVLPRADGPAQIEPKRLSRKPD